MIAILNYGAGNLGSVHKAFQFIGSPVIVTNDPEECMAASPRIYAQMVPLLQKYSKFASAAEKHEVAENTKTLRLNATPETK